MRLAHRMSRTEGGNLHLPVEGEESSRQHHHEAIRMRFSGYALPGAKCGAGSGAILQNNLNAETKKINTRAIS